MKKSRLFSWVAIVPLLGACGLDTGGSNQAVETTPGNTTATNNDQPQSTPAIKRGGLLTRAQSVKRTGLSEKKPEAVDPYLARYDKFRLDKAATLHNWSKLSIGSHGVESYLTTYWARGVTHLRVAVVGPRENLWRFQRDYQMLTVHLQDENCNSLRVANIPVKMMKMESSTPSGLPTLSYEGQLDCSLEEYEHIEQWFLEWN